MDCKLAHIFDARARTDDVIINEQVTFSGLLLSEAVQKGLVKAGFERPSPIQLKAIPIGRCGLDLIVQAKSGTGKTCVFSVILLESLILKVNSIQALILAPTREIAVQITDVIQTLGCSMPCLKCHCFIGGIPLAKDRQRLLNCHIAVGTPGRIKQLIESQLLNTQSIRLFVLDEADKLLEESFQEDINWIYSTLPSNKQMLALSATYPEALANLLTFYMRNPTFVRLNSADPALLGVKQFYHLVAFHPLPHKVFQSKTDVMLILLSSISFNQCLVFCNYQTSAQNLCELLSSKNWPAVFICSSLEQKERLAAINKLKQFQCRILVSTDLTARGIDAENVNLVINMDVPWDDETYLHRIGRAGRFGSLGLAITLASLGMEQQNLMKIQDHCRLQLSKLPDPIPSDLLISDQGQPTILPDIITIEQLQTSKQKSTERKRKKKCRSKTLPASSESDSQENIKPNAVNKEKFIRKDKIITSRNMIDSDTPKIKLNETISSKMTTGNQTIDEKYIQNLSSQKSHHEEIIPVQIHELIKDKHKDFNHYDHSIKISEKEENALFINQSLSLPPLSTCRTNHLNSYSSYFQLKEELAQFRKSGQLSIEKNLISSPNVLENNIDETINSLIHTIEVRNFFNTENEQKSNSEEEKISEAESSKVEAIEADVSEFSELENCNKKRTIGIKKTDVIWDSKINYNASQTNDSMAIGDYISYEPKDFEHTKTNVPPHLIKEIKESCQTKPDVEFLNSSDSQSFSESEISQIENETSSEEDSTSDSQSDSEDTDVSFQESITDAEYWNYRSKHRPFPDQRFKPLSVATHLPSDQNIFKKYYLSLQKNFRPYIMMPYFVSFPNIPYYSWFYQHYFNQKRNSWLYWIKWMEMHMQYIHYMTKVSR